MAIKKVDEPEFSDADKAGVSQEVTRETAPTEPVKQDLPTVEEKEDDRPQSYVWLANGSVVRVFDEDLPIGGGTGAPHGFWQSGDKVHQVVGVYPVETTVEKG